MGNWCFPIPEKEKSDPHDVLEDLRKRIRTQNIKVEQLKVNVFESKNKAKQCLEESDTIGAKCWLIKSRQDNHFRELEWKRYINNCEMLSTLEQAISNLDHAKHLKKAGKTLDSLLLEMPADLSDILDRIKESTESVETTSFTFEPPQEDINQELLDLQAVLVSTSLPNVPMGPVKSNTIQQRNSPMIKLME